ncbi:MAG: DUF502 domain-containing protein [Candidatus Omnitrophica bacterium]|nr:DUF502 domain-containing protein [Candidatus Omnitrophota bacterium]
MGNAKKYFFTGIATIFPVFVTVYILIILFKFSDSVLGKFINIWVYNNFGFKIPGLGVPVLAIVIFLVGFLTRHLLGGKILPWFESIFVRLPVVNHIYLPAKQLSRFLFGEGKEGSFKKVVLIQYPNEWSYSVGFLTNEGLEELNKKSGKELVSVLVSTPPSPFSGPLILVPKDRIKILDMSIEQAIKFVVSGGVVPPA